MIEMKETTSKFPIVLQNIICQKHAIMIFLQLEKLEKHDIYINLDLLEPAHMDKHSLTAQFMMRHLYGS